MRSFHFYFFVFILFIISSASAQVYNPKCRYTSIGFGIKGSYFDGDIATPLQYIRPGAGVTINRRVSPRVTLFSELMWIRFMGDDYTGSNLKNPATSSYYIRNLHFRNDIKELSLGFKYDLFPSTDHYRKRPIYNLYGGLGIGIFYHNPRAAIRRDTISNRIKWVELRPLQTENVEYSNWQISIPAMVGIRYKISLNWDMEVEVSYRYTFSDFLDDVSGHYQDPASLHSDLSRQLAFRSAEAEHILSFDARDLETIENDLGYSIVSGPGYSYVDKFGPGTSRGSKKGPDGLIIFNIRFLYAIPGAVNCPKFREF